MVIDEAQRVENIGLTLKLLYDAAPNLRIIATGSSSFELANKINEPLTGRAFEHYLFPLSLGELHAAHHSDPLVVKRKRDQYLRFGLYPEIHSRTLDNEAREKIIYNITEKYLYRDIQAYEGIRKPALLEKLTKVLATQVGSMVSFSELANTLDTSKQTIEAYIRILEQACIVFSVTPFSRNMRSELTKKRKIYFIDSGIRNALLQQHQPMDHRSDRGALWENFCAAERYKLAANHGKHVNFHFWRTHDGQEIDLIEEEGEYFRAFEVKYSPAKPYHAPPKWKKYYPNTPVSLIHTDNFLKYLIT